MEKEPRDNRIEEKKPQKGPRILLYYLLLHGALLLFSFGGVCSKIAGNQEFLSMLFIIFYGLLLVILFAYALIWQQVLKAIPLTVAYANKGILIFYGMLWGTLFFGEKIRPRMLIGALIVLVGVFFFLKDEWAKEKGKEDAA